MSTAQEALVAAQFGPNARAYVGSVDHARGADLERLSALVKAHPGCRVLDLGCGGGHVSYAVAPYAAAVVAYDLSPEMLAAVVDESRERGLGNITTERGTAADMPFPDASFDFVLTRMSAHHWGNVAAGLAEARRVLRPDGTVVVVDVVAPEDSALHDTFLQAIELLRDPSHVRDYAPGEWVAMLRSAGFRPSTPSISRLRLDFATWIQRIGTPEVQVEAIRALQKRMPADVVGRFAVEPDGSFTLDVALFEATVEPRT